MASPRDNPLESPVPIDELTRLYRAHVERLEKEYARVLAEAGFDSVLIHSGSPKIRSAYDDQYWPLRPTPHFQHWLPLAAQDHGLCLTPGTKPILYKDGRTNIWEAPLAPETDHFWNSFEVVELADPDLVKEVRPRGKVAFVGEDAARAAAWGFDEESRNPAALLPKLDALRTLKSDYEIVCLREANRRAAIGHRAVLAAFAGGDHSELSLHLRYLEATGQDDPETPYKNIVALGEHAATLHHVGYGRRKSGAQSLLLDAGATCQGYASDITRTAVKGTGHGAEVFAGLVAGLERLQLEMCARARPGVHYQALHDQSHELLAPVLREVGIAKASGDELVASGATRKFLPHGLGHSLGLQTHDVGCATTAPDPRNPFLRNTSVVASGQVFTIEPGCYFIGGLLDELRGAPVGKSVDWKLVETLRAFGGVRIEDDLLVTGEGTENFTRAFLPGEGSGDSPGERERAAGVRGGSPGERERAD